MNKLRKIVKEIAISDILLVILGGMAISTWVWAVYKAIEHLFS